MTTNKNPPLGAGGLPKSIDGGGGSKGGKRAPQRRLAPEPDLHEEEESTEEESAESPPEESTGPMPYPDPNSPEIDSFWLHVRQEAEAIKRQDYGYDRAQEEMLEALSAMPKYIGAGFANAYNLEEGDDLDGPKYEGPEDQEWMRLTKTAQEVRALCEEFEPLRRVRIELRLFNFKRKSRGRLLTGNARAVSVQDRACYAGGGRAPYFQVEISLAAWMVSDEAQRRALLHNALMACEVKTDRSGNLSPRKRQPDVVGYSATLSRFGATTKAIAQAALSVMQHPTTPERLEGWEIEPDGQGVLFPAYVLPKAESKTL